MALSFGRNLTSIYVIEAGNGAVKIGFSKDPGKRCRQIQISNRDNVCVVWAADLNHSDAIRIETIVHKKLRQCAIHDRGEWYTTRPETAVEFIKSELKKQKTEWTPNMSYAVDRSVSFT